MRKQVKKLTEEAATLFMGRLLSLRKKQGLTHKQLARLIGVSRETLYRWNNRPSIAADKAARICQALKIQEPEGLLVTELTGPKEFARCLDKAEAWSAKQRSQTARLSVGYASVWLANNLPTTNLEVQVQLGDSSLPLSRVVLKNAIGAPVAHVQFAASGGRLVYQAFGHAQGGEARLEFEGAADPIGFEFCQEFIKHKAEVKSTKHSALGAKMERTISHYYERHKRNSGS